MLDLMSEVTRILSAIEQGDPSAAGQLLPLVYDELRLLAAHRLAHEQPGQTLQATALVHEAYLRLVGVEPVQHWDSRRTWVVIEEVKSGAWGIAGRPLTTDDVKTLAAGKSQG